MELKKLKKENNKLNENISLLNENNINIENTIKNKDNEILILIEQQKNYKETIMKKIPIDNKSDKD